MKFSCLEKITPYKNYFEYDLYKFDCEINLGDEKSFICNLKIFVLDVENEFLKKTGLNKKIVAILTQLNKSNCNYSCIKISIVDFIMNEILLEGLTSENIEVIIN